MSLEWRDMATYSGRKSAVKSPFGAWFAILVRWFPAVFSLFAGTLSCAGNNQVMLRVTDENETPIADCRFFWKTTEMADWQEPQVIYRIGPNGVNGDGSVLAKVGDTVPQALEADARFRDVSINYDVIFNTRPRTRILVKVVADGFHPAETVIGKSIPGSNITYFFQAIHLRPHRGQQQQQYLQPQQYVQQPQYAPPQNYYATLIFIRSNNARAANVSFKLVMVNSGYTISGVSNGSGEAEVSLPEFGRCNIIFYQPNGKQKVVNDVIGENFHNNISVLWW